MTALEVRPVRDRDEYLVAFMQIGQYFGMEQNDDGLDRFMSILPLERMHVALDGGTPVGGAGAFPFELSVPGGSLPCGGTTVVGVSPTHRRRGVLTAMMRTQLEDMHERGEPLAALWASEAPIYGRFGYGLASFCGDVELARERSGFARPFERRATTRFVSTEEALELFPPIWEAVRRQRPGMPSRTPVWWEKRALVDSPERRGGAGPHRRVAFDLDGRTQAYAIYRHSMSWEAGSSNGAIRVVEALAETPEAERELWRYLLDVDWVARIEASLLPVDHPLFLLLAEPRRLKYRLIDALWVRLVDVGAALSGREYASDEPLVLDVVDPFCPWNEGRWRLAGGRAERTDATADLRVDAAQLGSVYLGGVTWAQLARAGCLEAPTPDAIGRADRVFATAAAPWCPEIF
jgi:predicted acetyltransferase